MWLPGSVFDTSNVTGEILRRAQSNNCTTNEDINPAFPSDQQSCQPEMLVMPSAFTLPSNIHSRHTLLHLCPSFATHPGSIERLPWEYPSHRLNIKQCHAQFPGRPRTIGMRQFRTPSPPLSPPSPVPPVPRLKGPLSSQPSLLSSPSKEYLVPCPHAPFL